MFPIHDILVWIRIRFCGCMPDRWIRIRIQILDPDPANFVIDLQDANKKLIHLYILLLPSSKREYKLFLPKLSCDCPFILGCMNTVMSNIGQLETFTPPGKQAPVTCLVQCKRYGHGPNIYKDTKP